MKLLLVEDEKQLSEALSQILINNKYSVDAVYDGDNGLEYALTDIYDVIILDIMLPKLNGLEILQKLRKESISTPILLLTAKDSVDDKVTGLDLGADDYLPKPFEPKELLARLRAISRRKGEVINDSLLTYGDINLNLSNYDLSCRDSAVTLTQKEFEILNYFMQRPKNIVSKDDLITKLWGFDSDVEYNNIEVYISFLRKKLTFINSSVKITTIRRAGYKLEK
ncbi:MULTISPECIES: response regulator transcription factor [Terrisporobacter]|uniref:Stage 0 sporulation protein A homolog n=2 Tax=Terrisporobacter TaxID=1505652 RepID=A0A0B3WWB2_9FIRM|nr:MULTISPECIES: response regulator transcription factor [Terrisporobacter]KHS58875.1 transcriptional regulator [Terrisporobacter othiniensis]MCC3670999.1 response regulator transcription factor [Terrisporobacter mayombei]MCR1823593.1 response regulator transcription factor [Terrisporobacter muris]MDU6984121.1 response regulator transcription factor [Terrisporobacter othiniensis]MDY3374810.1 response regulator transcription factor [Terrisporobacter othiniensis]